MLITELSRDVYREITRTALPFVQEAMLTAPTYDAGSIHYADDSRLNEGWIQGHIIVRTNPALFPSLEEMFPEIIQVAVSVLVQNGYLAPHRDAKVPRMNRYHIPLLTDSSAAWWDEDNGIVRMEQGKMYGPVPYTRLHFAVSSHYFFRSHLLVDVAEDA